MRSDEAAAVRENEERESTCNGESKRKGTRTSHDPIAS